MEEGTNRDPDLNANANHPQFKHKYEGINIDLNL